MKQHIKKIALALTAIAFTGLAHAQDAEACKLLLQDGLYKTFKMTRSSSFNQDLKTYFSSSTFRNDLHENKWGGSLSVIADGVPLGIGLNSSDNDISAFQ